MAQTSTRGSATVTVRRLAAAGLVTGALAGLAVATIGAHAQPQPQPRVDTREGGPRLHVVAKVHTGVQPKSVEVSPDGRRVYVCNFGRADRDNVKVYDADTLSEVGTVSFVGNAVESAFSPDGPTLYVSNFRADKLEVIDRATLTVRGEVSIPGDPKTIVVSRDGRTIFVARWSGASVAVIDADTLRIVRNLPAGNHPRGMVVFHDGQLMVAAMYDRVIYDFARGATRETRRIATCQFPRHLALSRDTRAAGTRSPGAACTTSRTSSRRRHSRRRRARLHGHTTTASLAPPHARRPRCAPTTRTPPNPSPTRTATPANAHVYPQPLPTWPTSRNPLARRPSRHTERTLDPCSLPRRLRVEAVRMTCRSQVGSTGQGESCLIDRRRSCGRGLQKGRCRDHRER